MSNTKHHEPKPPRDWRHVHHSPLFWVGFVLFVVAIAVYVLTEDLSWRPHLAHHAGTATAGERVGRLDQSRSRLLWGRLD